jgi:hypothetical protein
LRDVFSRSVFVNCPFDVGYVPLLRPLLFSIIYLGFEPRIALEQLDSGRPRIDKIVALIRESKFAVHDLSRAQAKEKGEYFRLNMPFELGLDVGCRLYKGGRWAEKRCLILEAERYRHQATISDLSNSDIFVHGNDPETLVTGLRNWLDAQAGLHAPGAAKVWASFLLFMIWNFEELTKRHYSAADIAALEVPDLIKTAKKWCSQNPWEASN